ncbi:hypothetical protein FB563_3453 [Streptomyces puniciscabiei]|uniref:Uncharacterized protein n=1 Tax=Streptomyces puniciscabiei TaxID=164348 RepID=A0A542UH65_9ACTN|nr:T3SS effector HopA1 family protein [Streptomyces puniciscabiei]TQK98427.1 hypothetical protein FB563_3453 [Streptomyces puniciscabiei]
MSTNDEGLPGWYRAVAHQLTVAPNLSRATVADREIETDNSRDMRRMLAEALYDILHAGQHVEKGELSFRLREEGFEAHLATAVPHERTTAPALVLRPAEDDGKGGTRLLVERDGVKLWLPAGLVRDADTAREGQVVAVTVPARRPALSPGFFVVDGTTPRSPHRELLRLYVHLDGWEAAAPVWAQVLEYLEERDVAYRSKVLSAKALYPRRDALVVYLGQESWDHIAALAALLDGLPGVAPESSVFAQRIVPGVSVAWEPDDRSPGMQGLSFGQHRATALAHALMDSAAGGEPLAAVLRARFTEAGIDPDNPARNLDSPRFPAFHVPCPAVPVPA